MVSDNFLNQAHLDLPKDQIVGLIGSRFVSGFFTKKNGEARKKGGAYISLSQGLPRSDGVRSC